MFTITFVEMSNGKFVARHEFSTPSLWSAITLLSHFRGNSNCGDFTVTKDGEPYPQLLEEMKHVEEEYTT